MPKLSNTLSTTTGCGCPEPWPQPMGLAEMTVKCKAEEFCKFSVTFWVDNEVGGANSPKRAKYIFRESISPLKTQLRRAYGTGTNIFLTGKFPDAAKFIEWKFFSRGNFSRSITSVRRPASAQYAAQLDPAGPPPTIATSKLSSARLASSQ